MRRLRRARSAALLGGTFPLALSMSACQAGAPEAEAFSVRDSAGIRIVESPERPPEGGVAWTVEAPPLLSIGAVDGPPEYQLFSVAGAVRLSDGRVAVLNRGTEELRIYGADGAHLTSAGGRGDGPGEFQGPSQLLRLPGDTLVVWDGASQTRSWFDADGRFARSQRVDRGLWEGRFGPRRVGGVMAALPDGGLLLRILVDRRGEYPLGRDRAPRGFARTSPDLSVVDTLGWHRGTEEFNVGDAAEGLYLPIPFFRSVHVAFGGDPPRVYVGGMEGEGDGYEIHAYGAGGRLEALVRHRVPRRPIGAEAREQVRQRERELLEGRVPDRELAAYLESVPEVLPPT